MDCRQFRKRLHRAAATGGPGGEAMRHAASCPACARESRAALLLRAGSEPPAGASLGPGFEAGLRARLAAGEGARAGAREGARGRSAWNGGIESLVRPALALAAGLALLCAGLYVRETVPSDASDVASLLESDPVFSSVLSASPGPLFGEADPDAAAPERP